MTKVWGGWAILGDYFFTLFLFFSLRLKYILRLYYISILLIFHLLILKKSNGMQTTFNDISLLFRYSYKVYTDNSLIQFLLQAILVFHNFENNYYHCNRWLYCGVGHRTCCFIVPVTNGLVVSSLLRGQTSCVMRPRCHTCIYDSTSASTTMDAIIKFQMTTISEYFY